MVRKEPQKNKKLFLCDALVLALLLVFFLGMFFLYGPGVYGDSQQYLAMHIHREPLYPLFLRGFTNVFGEAYLFPLGICQNVFMAVVVFWFTRLIAGQFYLTVFARIILVILQLLPHIMTKYFSAMSIFMTNSVMSEALTFPFFTLWFGNSLAYLWNKKRKNALGAMVFAFLLSLTRSQMMVTILLWMLMMLYQNVVCSKKHRIRAMVVILLLAAAAFGLRSLCVKTYNLRYNGHFIGNTYGNVTFLTNMLYAADREYGEKIEDEQAREFFYTMYDKADADGHNYKYAGNSVSERAEHLELCHDTIKFLYIEDVFYQYYDKNVTQNYILQNLMADETAMEIMKGIFPQCLGTWLKTYVSVAWYGFIRTIAVVHPLLNFAAAGIYLAAMILTFGLWKKDHQSGAVKMMIAALFTVAANVCAVAVTIMCLSRYVIYGFMPFYTAGFMVCIELLKGSRCGKLLTDLKEGKES